MSEALSKRQMRALSIMRLRPSRDLYEGAGPDGKSGCGWYWITYSSGIDYEQLNEADVNALLQKGYLVERYPGCYTLSDFAKSEKSVAA